MATVLVEALKGAQAEVAAQQGLFEQVKRAGKLTGILAQELRTAVSLTPFGIKAVRVRGALPTAGSPAADASPYGVVLHPAVPYGPKPRHMVDIYVPSQIYKQQQQQLVPSPGTDARQQHTEQPAQQRAAAAPVVFFVHGGIWVTGERWHFCPMATQLAQAGLVVVVPSYTLYPDALAGQMAAEVLAAYKWTALHVARYGGDPSNISVMGHSAGGHLGSLALLMLAQQKHLAAQTPQQQQQQPHKQQCEDTAVLGVQGSMINEQQKQQHHQQQGRQLPAQQLQQRAEVAAAETLHHQHHVHPQPQQQPQQQQQPPSLPEQDGPQWSSLGAGIVSVPIPAAFIGMSSVYDIARHFEFESLRGVAGISTMGRACGGAVSFDAVSPAAILRRAAASAREGRSSKGRRCHAAAQHSTRGQAMGQSSRAIEQQQQRGVQQAAPHGPVLLGEIIPYRSGLDERSADPHSPPRVNSHAANGTNAAGKQLDGQVAGSSSTSTGSSGANSLMAPGVVACSTSAALASFCAAAAKYMPPCILMSSLADHMVPWHEAAEMFLALRACGIPAKHLIYSRAQHNDFVLDWTPEKVAAPQMLARPAAHTSSSELSDSAAPPAFARDLMAILTGQVRVQYASGSPDKTAAAVAALERAAGLPQLHQQQDNPGDSCTPAAAAASGHMTQRLPQPLSRL